MRALALAVFGLVLGGALSAMGFTEDPQEKLTKTYPMAAVKVLEIRGQVEIELVPGPKGTVTIETSRALFDQLTVSNWWGFATVAIESGLRGPREQGTVKIRMALPSLDELNLTDMSTGTVTWPGTKGKIRVADSSSAVLTLEGTDFEVETSWKTQVSVRGHVGHLRADLRHQSILNTESLQAREVLVSLDENSTLESGEVVQGSGSARHQSVVIVAQAEPWSGLALREGSEMRVRDESASEPQSQ